MINADDVCACILDVPSGHLIAHGNNDLLMGRTLGGHIDVRLWFALTAINDFLNLIDFLILKLKKHFFDFESVHSNVRVLRFERSLSVGLSL